MGFALGVVPGIVPDNMRLVMLGATLGIFAAFTVAGLFSSLVPSFLRGILGVQNLAVIGAASLLLFGTAAISQALSARAPTRPSVSLGLPVLLAGIGALEGSLFAGTLWLFLVGTVDASAYVAGLVAVVTLPASFVVVRTLGRETLKEGS